MGFLCPTLLKVTEDWSFRPVLCTITNSFWGPSSHEIGSFVGVKIGSVLRPPWHNPLDAPSPPLSSTARHGTGRHKPFTPPPPPQPYPPGPYRKSALKIDRNEVLHTYTGPLGPNVIFFCCLPLASGPK